MEENGGGSGGGFGTGYKRFQIASALGAGVALDLLSFAVGDAYALGVEPALAVVTAYVNPREVVTRR